jgi:hypothetical protein
LYKKAASGPQTKTGKAVKEIAGAGLEAVMGVYYGFRDAGRVLAENAKAAMVNSIQYKYGDDAAYACQEALNSLRDVGLAAWYIMQIWGATALEMAIAAGTDVADHTMNLKTWLTESDPVRQKS